MASCEFTGQLNSTKTAGATSPGEAMRMGGASSGLMPGASAMPQDVRLTPDRTRFLVADMLRNGIWVIRASTQGVERFIPTGKGAHGIYPDGRARGSSSATAMRASSRFWTRHR